MSAIVERSFNLPDPWRFPQGGRHPLLDLAADAGAEAERRLVAAVRELLLAAADAEVRRALAMAPGREAYSRVWRALCAASEGAGGPAEAVAASVFALPLAIVTGARTTAELPGTLARPDALAGVLRDAGALGASRNFGFANALADLGALERIAPSALLAWRDPAAGDASRAVEPAPVAVRPGEEVHLRFLVGAAITPADAPSVSETAAHLGAWGMAFARALGRQLAVPGVELLVLPRPPAGVVRAACRGRRAQLEVALNLFLSNALRRMRLAAGEPTLVISAHECEGGGGGELRASMSAALDDTLLEGFRWPLHPLEDPNEIAAGVAQFAADCRMTDIRFAGAVLPERGPRGERAFLRAADVPPAPASY